ncbi:MAG: (d)CMP kinase [bacterium]
MPNKVIAIDGPSASGKSTVARKVAARLGYKYVDSGALYRGLAWKVVELGLDPSDPAAVIAAMQRIKVEFIVESEAIRYRMNGVEPREEIRMEKVNESVSFVAAIPEVRAQVTQWLQAMISYGNLVMEGRDIGTVVFPGAAAKFYLDASPEERARRRHAELKSENAPPDVGRVMVSLTNRDKRDSGRKTAPLKLAEDAQVVDTTGLNIDQVVDEIVRRLTTLPRE